MKHPATIPVFFTADEEYAPYLSTALISLIEHSSPSNHYEINIIHHKLRLSSRRKIQKLAKGHGHIKIIFTAMKKSITGISDRKETRLKADCFTPTIYYRIFLAEMFPQYDRAIYLDSDTIILADLAELFCIDLEGQPIAACPDASTQDKPLFMRYFKDAIGVNPKKYINSGVILMDLKKLREEEFCEHFLFLLNTYDFDTVAPDQDYMNAMLKGRIKFLDGAWNTMPNARKSRKKPKIIHYNLFFKPWHYDHTPYGEYFWNYAAKSPFLRNIEAEKANFGKHGEKTDDDRLRQMEKRVEEILATDQTFKTVFSNAERKGK